MNTDTVPHPVILCVGEPPPHAQELSELLRLPLSEKPSEVFNYVLNAPPEMSNEIRHTSFLPTVIMARCASPQKLAPFFEIARCRFRSNSSNEQKSRRISYCVDNCYFPGTHSFRTPHTLRMGILRALELIGVSKYYCAIEFTEDEVVTNVYVDGVGNGCLLPKHAIACKTLGILVRRHARGARRALQEV